MKWIGDVIRQLLLLCLSSIHYINGILSVLGRGRRVGVFVAIGGTGILFHLLVTASKEAVPSEELMLQLHLLLAKVGPKGRTVSHINWYTCHSAGFKPYYSILSWKTIIFFSGVFIFPFILCRCKWLRKSKYSLRVNLCFNVCLSRQKVWSEGSTERSCQCHCQLNQTKPA